MAGPIPFAELDDHPTVGGEVKGLSVPETSIRGIINSATSNTTFDIVEDSSVVVTADGNNVYWTCKDSNGDPALGAASTQNIGGSETITTNTTIQLGRKLIKTSNQPDKLYHVTGDNTVLAIDIASPNRLSPSFSEYSVDLPFDTIYTSSEGDSLGNPYLFYAGGGREIAYTLMNSDGSPGTPTTRKLFQRNRDNSNISITKQLYDIEYSSQYGFYFYDSQLDQWHGLDIEGSNNDWYIYPIREHTPPNTFENELRHTQYEDSKLFWMYGIGPTEDAIVEMSRPPVTATLQTSDRIVIGDSQAGIIVHRSTGDTKDGVTVNDTDWVEIYGHQIHTSDTN